MGMILAVFYFLIAISILVSIHEFGHFWVARRLGVKVLRFSIGFGKPIWKTTFGADKTEFVIAALPLGGYVKMLDERDSDVDKEELSRTFNRKPVASRLAIVVAGPLFNFFFAIIAYWLMFSVGLTSFKPIVGEVLPETPAAMAGLKTTQEIIDINDMPTPTFEVATEQLMLGFLDKKTLHLTVKNHDDSIEQLNLDLSAIKVEFKPEQLFSTIGFYPWKPSVPATIDNIQVESPASKAGILPGDTITYINSKQINNWSDLVKYISLHPTDELFFTLRRGNSIEHISLTPTLVEHNGKQIGQVGFIKNSFPPIPEHMVAEYRYPVFTSIEKAITETWDKTLLSIRLLGKLVAGDIAFKHLSGPIGIAQHAGRSAEAGLAWFLGFLAILSINLGILNLLPIPMLDGGHLMYYTIEAIKGKPVSKTLEMIGQRLGVAFLIVLMSLAFYNDLARIFA